MSTNDLKPCTVLIGNPGVGKSTLLNGLAGQILFKSGISYGRGLTQCLQFHSSPNGDLADTPGLADTELRKQAAEEITKLLRMRSKLKIVFVVSLMEGRVRPEDVATMVLVLESLKDALPDGDMTDKFSILINKVFKGSMEDLKDPEILKLVVSCFNSTQYKTKHIELVPEEDALRGVKDRMVDRELIVKLIEACPTVSVNTERVAEINTTTIREIKEEAERRIKEFEEHFKRMQQENEAKLQAAQEMAQQREQKLQSQFQESVNSIQEQYQAYVNHMDQTQKRTEANLAQVSKVLEEERQSTKQMHQQYIQAVTRINEELQESKRVAEQRAAEKRMRERDCEQAAAAAHQANVEAERKAKEVEAYRAELSRAVEYVQKLNAQFASQSSAATEFQREAHKNRAMLTDAEQALQRAREETARKEKEKQQLDLQLARAQEEAMKRQREQQEQGRRLEAALHQLQEKNKAMESLINERQSSGSKRRSGDMESGAHVDQSSTAYTSSKRQKNEYGQPAPVRTAAPAAPPLPSRDNNGRYLDPANFANNNSCYLCRKVRMLLSYDDVRLL